MSVKDVVCNQVSSHGPNKQNSTKGNHWDAKSFAEENEHTGHLAMLWSL